MTVPEDVQPIPARAKPASLWEDFIDIFVSPSEVFERRQHAGFFLALLVFAVLLTVLYIVGKPALQPVFDAEWARNAAAAARKNPGVSPEQMEKGRAMVEKFGVIGVAFGAFIAPLVTGLVLWIVGKFFDATESVGAACMVAVYAFFPRLLEQVINVAQGFVLDPALLNGQYRLRLGPSRFFDPDTASPILLALIGRLDVFTIWVTILLAIGLSVVGKIPRSRAYVAAAIVWVIGALPALLAALRQG